MTETGNQYIARLASQMTWFYRTYVNSDSPAAMGISNNNYFARPLNDDKTIRLGFLQNSGGDTSDISLAQWQSQYNLDLNSKKSPLTYTGNIDDSLRFEYNASNVVKSVALNADYVDVTGKPYTGSVNLNPWTSVVLFRNKTSTIPTPTPKQNQVIAFPAIPAKTFGDPAFTLNATASSGLPVSYRVLSGPATVSGNTVTLTGPGLVIVEASQAGNASFNAALPVQQSFSVADPGGSGTTPKQNQTITFGTLAYKTYSSPPFELTATASSGLPVSYRVVSGPITISGNVVTITGVGSATIEASQAGNASFNAAAPVQRSFTIGKASQTITFPTIANRTVGAGPFTLNATASSGLPVSYRVVSGPATVSGNTVTVTGTGTVTIEASQPGNEFYSAAFSPQRSFTVTAQ
jgi:hypothetical protein